MQRLPSFVATGLLTMACLALQVEPLEAQRDSTIVVEIQQQADSAFALVLEAFAGSDIDIAVASSDQGLILSRPSRMGRDQQIAYAQYRADLEGLGPITRVVLRGLLSSNEDLERQVTVTSGSFFHGAVVWARLQAVGRELRDM